MPEILEIAMLVSFGASWPLNVVRSWRSRTARGKSIPFLCLICLGYVAGILSKLTNAAYLAAFGEKWYVLCFYVLNLIMVGVDLGLTLRNARLDRAAGR